MSDWWLSCVQIGESAQNLLAEIPHVHVIQAVLLRVRALLDVSFQIARNEFHDEKVTSNRNLLLTRILEVVDHRLALASKFDHVIVSKFSRAT